MENVEKIERTEFVVLAGHLDDQPLPDLIRRLRVQRKTGRLQVEYADAPGSFFFEEGQLVDARLGTLRGVEALYAALALDGAAFNFNPLVRPPERSIDRQGQKFVHDLIEGPRREGLAEVRVAGRELDAPPALPSSTAHAPLQLAPVAAELVAPIEQRLTAVEEAIVSTSRRFTRERMVYAVVIGFLAGLSLVAAVNAIFDPFGANTPPTTAAQPAPLPEKGEQAVADDRASAAGTQAPDTNRQGEAATAGRPQASAEPPPPVPATAAVIGTRRADSLPSSRREYVVQVLVEVKGGRVTNARVWNPRPGAEAYEAVALKMARERRYPENFTGGERLRISVKP